MPCYYQKKNPIQRFLMVAALLGMAVMFTWLLAILWYLGERLSILPYFMVGISWFDISWLDLTEGEKWLIFITGMFVIPFIEIGRAHV